MQTPSKTVSEIAFQQCISPSCLATFGVDEVLTACTKCGGLLDVSYDWNAAAIPASLSEFESKWSNRHDPLCYSGVWRFRELLPFAPPEKIVTVGEGQTLLQQTDPVGAFVGLDAGNLFLQYLSLIHI